jgi:thiol-disulfide isomerase/thioredoxin
MPLPAQEKIYKTTAPLQVPRQMYGTVVLGNYLYVIGGNIQGKGDDPQGYVTTVDGHLESWQESEPYPGTGVKLSAAVATPGYISIIAGKDMNGNPTRDIWSAKVGPQGDIAGWEKCHPLPSALYFHQAAVSGGRVWVWGGLIDDSLTINDQVFEALILSSGGIGNWSISNTKLQRPFFNAAVTVSGEYLLSFAPRDSSQISSGDIWFTTVKFDGLSEWQSIQTDITSKLYIGVATDYRRGIIYIPGGRMNALEDESSLTGTVFMLKLASSAKDDSRTESAMSPSVYGPASGDSQLSYIQQSQQAASVFPDFPPYDQTRQISQSQSKPLVVYFYSNKAKPCQSQAQILQNFNGLLYQGRVIFAEVNVENFPQTSQQYGVFRVPNWIFFDGPRVIKFRQDGVLSLQTLEACIRSIAP